MKIYGEWRHGFTPSSHCLPSSTIVLCFELCKAGMVLMSWGGVGDRVILMSWGGGDLGWY